MHTWACRHASYPYYAKPRIRHVILQLSASVVSFKFPEPGYLEGVKTKDKAILKMHKVGFWCAVPHLLNLLAL